MPDKSALYRQWLGIEQASPNYYQLLGVANGESDANTLQQAAQAALAKLKQLSVADADNHRREIAREIKQAYTVLADPNARARYDALLKRPVAAPTSTDKTTPIPLVVEVDREPMVAESGDAKISIRVPKKRASRGMGSPLTWLALVGIFVVGPAIVISWIWFASPRKDNPHDRTDPSGAAMAATANRNAGGPSDLNASGSDENASALAVHGAGRDCAIAAANSASLDIDAGRNESLAVAAARLSADVAARGGQAADRGDAAHTAWTFAARYRLLQIRWRLAERNYAQAASIVADELSASSNEEQKLLWTDWAKLVDDMRTFWEEFEAHASQIKAAREFELDGEPCSVIGIEPAGLLFKSQGTSLLARWEHLPPETVFSLVESVGIRDIPTWRKTKSAWLISRGTTLAAYRKSIAEWLDQAEADGHDVQHLQRILRRSLANVSEATPSGPSVEETTAALVAVLQTTRTTPLRASRSELEQSLAIAARTQEPQDRLDHLIRGLRLAIAEDHWNRCREVTDLIALEHPLDAAAVLLECGRQIVDRDQIAGQAAASLVDDLIELSGLGWNGNGPRSDSGAFLELAGELSAQRNLRLQSNRLSRLK